MTALHDENISDQERQIDSLQKQSILCSSRNPSDLHPRRLLRKTSDQSGKLFRTLLREQGRKPHRDVRRRSKPDFRPQDELRVRPDQRVLVRGIGEAFLLQKRKF